jgi:pyruvate dehydrogenase E2 component (dihydrolipoamide acetyltransferase)
MATELTMPRLSDSMEDGTILRWLVAEGDRVQAGQELVEVETDKATVTHEALADGVVLALLAAEGDSVAVGAPIAMIGEPGEEVVRAAEPVAVAAAVEAPPAPAPAPARAESPARSSNGGRVMASPLARRVAAEAGIDLSGLTGSGPQGRVIRADVQRAMNAGPRLQPLSRVQQTVARRMAQSRAEVPDIELRSQVDMTATVALREQLRELGDVVPSLNDFVVKAAALALREFPRVNGAYRDGGFELFEHVNVGIAVAVQDALLVPVVHDADRRSLGEIASETRSLAQQARDGSIAPAQLEGGTFTVSNLGMYGVDSFSAVINQPQAAILTVGSLDWRAVVDSSGAVVARQTVTLTLVCDHRILYGADGAQFLARVRELLERPLAMLI